MVTLDAARLDISERERQIVPIHGSVQMVVMVMMVMMVMVMMMRLFVEYNISWRRVVGVKKPLLRRAQRLKLRMASWR